jgi:hypothetical protein
LPIFLLSCCGPIESLSFFARGSEGSGNFVLYQVGEKANW